MQPPVPPAVPPAPLATLVRIGIGRSLTGAEVKAAGGMQVIADGRVQLQLPAGQSAKMTLVSGKILVAGLTNPLTGPVRLVPVMPPTGNNFITYNNKPYRGEIEVLVTRSEQKLSVVNVVDVEEYLLGVVAKEVYASWHMEALKAQAVAARTYALKNIGSSLFAAQGFDMTDTTASQEYGGVQGEHSRTTEAVKQTRGQVLTYQGQLVQAYYHASSGGHTENNECIFVANAQATALPIHYLRGVKDFDDLPDNKFFSWKSSFDAGKVEWMLRSAGYDVGPLQSVEPTGSMDDCVRPSRWKFVGAKGSVILTAEQTRGVLSLPSSPRTLALHPAVGGTPAVGTPSDTVQVMGADRKPHTRSLWASALIGAKREPVLAPVAPTILGAKPAQGDGAGGQQTGTLEAGGGGHGHGVGMSQWGAYGRALMGEGYVEILQYYYRGTKVENR